MLKFFLLFFVFISTPVLLLAQSATDTIINPGIKQVDLIDIGQRILHKNSVTRDDLVVNKKGKVHFSAFQTFNAQSTGPGIRRYDYRGMQDFK